MAGVPFATCALVGTIPQLAMTDLFTMQGLLDDFCTQFQDLHTCMENIMQTRQNTFVVHCYNREKAQLLLTRGLTLFVPT